MRWINNRKCVHNRMWSLTKERCHYCGKTNNSHSLHILHWALLSSAALSNKRLKKKKASFICNSLCFRFHGSESRCDSERSNTGDCVCVLIFTSSYARSQQVTRGAGRGFKYTPYVTTEFHQLLKYLLSAASFNKTSSMLLILHGIIQLLAPTNVKSFHFVHNTVDGWNKR